MSDEGSTSTPLAPVIRADRVEALDILRGVAVLGILMMNITAFGLLFHAYGNPLAGGGADGPNLIAYKIIQVGFEGTMRGIFSLLFGASIVLLTERMEASGAGLMTAEIHFRRMLWMMLFGVIHWALLLWTGEILFAYSLCGLVLFALRKLRPGIQIAAALLLLIGAAAIQTHQYHDAVKEKAAATVAEAAKTSGAKLTTEQEAAIESWQEQLGHVTPAPEEAKAIRDIHKGSWWNAVVKQWPGSVAFQWKGAPFWLLFDMIPFMLLGMGLLKLGILGGAAPPRLYLAMALAGYGVGIPLGIYELNLVLDARFDALAFAEADRTYELSRLAMVIGHLGLLLLFIRSGIIRPLQCALAATGQMALSNYLMQTIICTALFYGFGFGLFEAFQRYQLYGVVAAIWIAELIWSPLWLRHYRFGPFEWLWRSLTYWKLQPMRLA
ncbi:DUF418 domain-containing protein [Rhizorhabdus dicambivorans]|uniref:DUF418 domain-containing protein n=1 Tax=Rhizorhabdus dicambivorans TaxID=1850238 RepID=A0A2A4FVY7_9SPHN|nr:DUF418 domain-containing protein [Rhizorhabdus dicambivorans]ATE65547.1 DUF418 domain-containing protein [Rhizorhabdus dicambivorans]PCE41890.1 DUF418 domain-containing protein [Rhizorhabdus dicambivorans]